MKYKFLKVTNLKGFLRRNKKMRNEGKPGEPIITRRELHKKIEDLEKENAELKAELEKAKKALEMACYDLRPNYHKER